MIVVTAEHAALLAHWTREFWAVDLYELSFLDGTTLRYSGHALPTIWNGYTWTSGPLFRRGETKIICGLETDTLQVEITPREGDTLLGLPWPLAIRNGALDGARVAVYRGHAEKPGAPLAGAFLRFRGMVGNVKAKLPILMPIKSELVLLDAPIPRDVWQAGCSRTLFDAGCGASRTAFRHDGQAAAGSTTALVVASLPHAAGYYSAGEIRWVSGANAGARRAIRRHDGTGLHLSYPLLEAITPGDTFQLWPGCAHTWEECQDKFANGTRFNGQPFVPAPETAV